MRVIGRHLLIPPSMKRHWKFNCHLQKYVNHTWLAGYVNIYSWLTLFVWLSSRTAFSKSVVFWCLFLSCVFNLWTWIIQSIRWVSIILFICYCHLEVKPKSIVTFEVRLCSLELAYKSAYLVFFFCHRGAVFLPQRCSVPRFYKQLEHLFEEGWKMRLNPQIPEKWRS